MKRSILAAFVSLSIVFTTTTATAARPTGARSKAVKLLRPAQIRKLNKVDKRRYFRSLHKTLAILSHRAPQKRKAALHELFLTPAYAEETGACLIGGYFGRYEKQGSTIACVKPDRGQVWESEKEEFECGKTPAGERMGYCNSAFYLYANDQHSRMCEPVKTLSESCAKKFEARYLTEEGAARLANDTAHLLTEMGQEELEDYYNRLDEGLNTMITSGDRDSANALILQQQLDILNGFRMNTGGATATREKTDAASEEDSEPSNASLSSPPSPRAAPELAAPRADSRLLGKELGCVRDGLVSLGLQPSEKYLALLGAGVQMSRGPFKTTLDPEALQNFQSEVIGTVQAFGICSEAAYPSQNLTDPQSAMHVRNLLTADNGKITSTGMDYVGQALAADARARSGSFYRLFGLRGQAKGIFQFSGATDPVERGLSGLFPDANTWNSKKITDQQRLLSGWKGHGDALDKTSFEKCQKDAAARMNQGGQAFNLEALSTENRYASVRDSLVKDKMVNVSKESLKVCTAMAEACALETAQVCGSSKGLVVDPASNLKTGPQKNSPGAKPAPGTVQ